MRHFASKFTFWRAIAGISAELSELGSKPFGELASGNAGIIIVSDKTGESVAFKIQESFRDADDDLICCYRLVLDYGPPNFGCSPEARTKMFGWTLYVYND